MTLVTDTVRLDSEVCFDDVARASTSHASFDTAITVPEGAFQIRRMPGFASFRMILEEVPQSPLSTPLLRNELCLDQDLTPRSIQLNELDSMFGQPTLGHYSSMRLIRIGEEAFVRKSLPRIALDETCIDRMRTLPCDNTPDRRAEFDASVFGDWGMSSERSCHVPLFFASTSSA